jgi:hypothetical protein
MNLGYWELEVSAGIGNKVTDPYGMLNQFDQ